MGLTLCSELDEAQNIFEAETKDRAEKCAIGRFLDAELSNAVKREPESDAEEAPRSFRPFPDHGTIFLRRLGMQQHSGVGGRPLSALGEEAERLSRPDGGDVEMCDEDLDTDPQESRRVGRSPRNPAGQTVRPSEGQVAAAASQQPQAAYGPDVSTLFNAAFNFGGH